MHQIQLSNATFEGDNNVYLFDGAETGLVDTGDWTPETREQLSDALAARGLSFADIDRLFLTHWHGDHVGLAADIQAASGATVYIHEDDAPLVAGDPDAWARLDELHEQRFEHWGIPEYGRETLRNIFGHSGNREDAPDVTPIQGGDSFTVNGRRVEAVHAPGHAAGLCMYAFGDEVLTGDALLPQYTPNVGGADVRLEQPLANYLETDTPCDCRQRVRARLARPPRRHRGADGTRQGDYRTPPGARLARARCAPATRPRRRLDRQRRPLWRPRGHPHPPRSRRGLRPPPAPPADRRRPPRG